MRVFEVFPLEEMSKDDRPQAIGGLIALFDKYGISVTPILTRHFQDRLWSREKSITVDELLVSFSKALANHHEQIFSQLKHDGKFAGVIKDYASNLNIVFTLENPVETPTGNKYRLYGITVMRKQPNQFYARDGEVLIVENTQDDTSNKTKKPRIHAHFKWKDPKKGQNQLIKQLWLYSNADAT